MTTSENDFIVAIELGSSKISGIAGKKKDGTWQILAYAEEKSAGCIRRGVVYNIEKTYQCVNNIVNKLEQVMKTKVARAYVGIGGQSMRSYKCVIKRNMLTQSYITNEAIDAMRQDSYEIPFADYEVLENFPQEYKVDGNTLADPVGVMGTNVEGEFLDVIARQKLRQNIETVFATANIVIPEVLISPLHMADNVLTDAEKRSGCALVDIGAETTTLLIYKNNIIRYLVTIPLGCNNINKDLATLPVDDVETENIKLKYSDACYQDVDADLSDEKYVTADGQEVDVVLIKNVIESRMNEIIANVDAQLVNSNYSGKLLSGIVITGGGCNMKNLSEAFKKGTKIDKVRVAKKVNLMVAKTSNASGITLDNAQSNTIVSLLMAGTVPCGGDSFDNSDIFAKQQKDDELKKRQAEQEALAAQEAQDATTFDAVKKSIRTAYDTVQKQINELENYGKDKEVRKRARELSLNIVADTLGEKYEAAAAALDGKDKFKQSLKEGAELADKLQEVVAQLVELVKRKDEENSAWGRFKSALKSITEEDN